MRSCEKSLAEEAADCLRAVMPKSATLRVPRRPKPDGHVADAYWWTEDRTHRHFVKVYVVQEEFVLAESCGCVLDDVVEDVLTRLRRVLDAAGVPLLPF